MAPIALSLETLLDVSLIPRVGGGVIGRCSGNQSSFSVDWHFSEMGNIFNKSLLVVQGNIYFGGALRPYRLFLLLLHFVAVPSMANNSIATTPSPSSSLLLCCCCCCFILFHWLRSRGAHSPINCVTPPAAERSINVTNNLSHRHHSTSTTIFPPHSI